MVTILDFQQALTELQQADAGPHADKKGAIVNGMSNALLTSQLQGLTVQIPTAVHDMSMVISANTKNIIASNEKVATSNEAYAKSMNRLTVFIMIANAVSALASVASIVVTIIYKN
jgi:hypothetical protein